MNDAPAPAEPAAEPATPAETAAAGLETLAADKAWNDDFAGLNGRPAQLAAMELKSATTRAAFDPEPDTAPVLPDAVQAGLDAPDSLSQAAAAAMIPGASPDDYKFKWDNAATSDIETLQAQSSIAADAAFAIGASPEYATATVRALEDMVAKSSGIEATEATLQEALGRQFGANADATVTAAKASLAKMSPEAREWAINSAAKLDASGVAWFVGRLASVQRANG